MVLKRSSRPRTCCSHNAHLQQTDTPSSQSILQPRVPLPLPPMASEITHNSTFLNRRLGPRKKQSPPEKTKRRMNPCHTQTS